MYPHHASRVCHMHKCEWKKEFSNTNFEIGKPCNALTECFSLIIMIIIIIGYSLIPILQQLFDSRVGHHQGIVTDTV